MPNWKDLNPRFGGAYDLFGDGRTALKATLGRYLGFDGLLAVQVADANNPLVTSVNSTTRTWNDLLFPVGDPRRGNFLPDCNLANPLENDECGAYANQNFGKGNPNATRWSDDVLRGFAKRDYLWDFSTEIQQQIGSRMSVTGGYYRNSAGNFRVTDNLAVAPEDYSSYCVTAPADARLPGGGAYPVCGLTDVAPAKFGRILNFVTGASDYGKQTRVSDFFNVTAKTRFASGGQFGGGVDTGRTVTDRCFVVDSLQDLQYCHVVTPFSALTQLKLFGSYPLPAAFIVSGTYQHTAGIPTAANWAVPNAQIAPSLNRNLAACGVQTIATCTATATVALIAPQTAFEKARSQLDLRLSKVFMVGSGKRLQANFDVYNLFNDDTILGVNNTYGSAAWLRPTAVLDSRLIQFGGQLTF